jgi:transcriptional regulator with XRE-family HTH domain
MAAGVNVLQAAQRAGLMHGSLQRWEKLSVIPRVDTLNRLLEVFGYELIIVRKGRE